MAAQERGSHECALRGRRMNVSYSSCLVGSNLKWTQRWCRGLGFARVLSHLCRAGPRSVVPSFAKNLQSWGSFFGGCAGRKH
jgi:hypothetical protein